MDQELEKLEEVESEEYDSAVPPIEIVAYNESRYFADLFRMAKERQLIIEPDF